MQYWYITVLYTCVIQFYAGMMHSAGQSVIQMGTGAAVGVSGISGGGYKAGLHLDLGAVLECVRACAHGCVCVRVHFLC